MKIIKEDYLRNFNFWGSAAEKVKYLTDDQLDLLEEILETEFPQGVDETYLNDMFAHNSDRIAWILGYENFDQLIEEVEAERREAGE